MGLGKFRPNEQLCYNQIICPECDSLFEPDCYIFFRCSAKINFCIVGESADQISLSEDREDKARQLGQRGERVNYEMLVIEVERPGTFPNRDSLEVRDTLEGAVAQFRSFFELALEQAYQLYSPTKRMKTEADTKMNPCEIFYIQDSIGNRFQCGRSVCKTMQELQKDLDVSEIPTIRVSGWNGRWHTEDNRRLWCFRAAGLSSVPVKRIEGSRVDPRKFTTRNGKTSIVMR
jgi:hypothetical protein